MPSKSWFRPNLTVGGCRPSGGEASVGRARVSKELQLTIGARRESQSSLDFATWGGRSVPVKPVLNETEKTGSPQREGRRAGVKVLYIEDNDDGVYMLNKRIVILGS